MYICEMNVWALLQAGALNSEIKRTIILNFVSSMNMLHSATVAPRVSNWLTCCRSCYDNWVWCRLTQGSRLTLQLLALARVSGFFFGCLSTVFPSSLLFNYSPQTTEKKHLKWCLGLCSASRFDSGINISNDGPNSRAFPLYVTVDHFPRQTWSDLFYLWGQSIKPSKGNCH